MPNSKGASSSAVAEQNPETKSRWAQLAREGKKVMQFLSGGRYVANVVDGKATVYWKLLHSKQEK